MPGAVYRDCIRVAGWSGGTAARSQTAAASGDVGDATSLGQSFGGLVGQNKGGMIRGSSATGDVTRHERATIGGLVGRNEGTITESAASGAVTGEQAVGGLVGYDRGVSSGDSISCEPRQRQRHWFRRARRRAGGAVGRNNQGQLRDPGP